MTEIPPTTEAAPAPAGVHRVGPLALLGAGRTAFREVPGLRLLLLKGFLLLYGIFVVVSAVVLGLVYRYVIQPLSQGMASYDVGGNFFLDLLFPLLSGLLWLSQVLLLAATLLLSFMLTLSLMTVWFEAVAERVANHARGGALGDATFRFKDWLASLGRSLRDSLLMLVLAVVSLVVGFVPLLGPFLVFAVAAYVMGWEVREPYLAVRAARGADLVALRKGLTAWTLRVGMLPVVLAIVPWVGWLLLPVVLVYMVAGVAWSSEKQRA